MIRWQGCQKQLARRDVIALQTNEYSDIGETHFINVVFYAQNKTGKKPRLRQIWMPGADNADNAAPSPTGKKKSLSGGTPDRLSQKKVAATYSPTLRSTIGAFGLNFSVRNGKRWNPGAITT